MPEELVILKYFNAFPPLKEYGYLQTPLGVMHAAREDLSCPYTDGDYVVARTLMEERRCPSPKNGCAVIAD